VPTFTEVGLREGREAALARIPARAGVGQILGPDRKNLVIGRPANLRRWAGNHLGLGKPPAKGKRPPTDLSTIATAVVFAESTSSFHQRLLFERLMEPHVPRSKRRDLKPPAFVHLDPAERFPRLVVHGADDDLRASYGPFRDRRAAERLRTVVQKLWPLRPCDYVFEPDPELPLGLGCLFAQVRTCAAPCLVRASEAEYQALAAEVAAVLAGDAPRPAELEGVLPAHVAAAGARGVVAVSNKQGGELYPVVAGAVLEENRVELPEGVLDPESAGLETALAALRFEAGPASRDDRPWLLAWLATTKRGAAYLPLPAPLAASALLPRVRDVLT
jgi:hypothetical protein